MKEGKFAEAAADYRELVRVDQISTPSSPYAGSDLFALGSVLMELNRVDDAKADAEKLWLRATELVEKNLGDASPQFDSVYLHLAQLYTLTSEYKEAQSMLTRFLDIEKKLVPGGSLAQALGLAELGNTFTRLRQYHDAELMLTNSVVMLARLPDPVPLTSAFVGTYLGDYYMTQSGWSDAESSYRQALKLRQTAAPRSALVADSLNDVANALDKLKRRDEAKKYKDQAQAIRAHYNPASSGQTVDVKSFREK